MHTDSGIKSPDKATVSYDARNTRSMALDDLYSGLKEHQIWWNFAVYDITNRFRRSIIGPFWITLSLLIWITVLTIVNTEVFKQDMDTLVPVISVGMIFWTFFVSALNEGCHIFISNESLILSLPVQLSTHLYRMIANNFVIFLFNMIIYLGVLYFYIDMVSWHFLMFLPGLLIFVINLSWLAMLFGILSTRFRDIPKITSSMTQVLFFVTPVFWLPDESIKSVFILANPIYHLLEIVRSPLLGQQVTYISWLVTILAAVVGSTVTILVYRRFYTRIPYWI